MTITLRDIDCENFGRCVKLEVRDDQKNFVAPKVNPAPRRHTKILTWKRSIV